MTRVVFSRNSGYDPPGFFRNRRGNFQKTLRAGIIPYCVVGDKIYFCLARDARTGDLGDFGGGVKFRESVAQGALREFEEETRGVFDIINLQYVSDKSIQCTDERLDNTTFFVRVDPEWMELANERFSLLSPSNSVATTSSESTSTHDEVSEIVWVDEKKFGMLINFGVCETSRDKMWSRISTFLLANRPSKNQLLGVH